VGRVTESTAALDAAGTNAAPTSGIEAGALEIDIAAEGARLAAAISRVVEG
jgi:MoxR-like ATPase